MKVNKQLFVLFVSFILSIALSCGTADENNKTSVIKDDSSERVNDYLNYGIYWLGYNSVQQKYVPGIENPYYDPHKPTVIYFHGWRKGRSHPDYQIVNMHFDKSRVWAQNSWLDRGWNVAIYHWGQWADEDDVQWAESKI